MGKPVKTEVDLKVHSLETCTVRAVYKRDKKVLKQKDQTFK